MDTPDGYRLVQLGPDDRAELVELDALAFFDPEGEDPPLPLTWERTAGVRAEQDGALAAVRSSFAFDLPVPGGSVPAAGLTWVAVHPAHRRRRLLSTMVGEHLRRTRERGEPVSVLTASEPVIYGRFGYGCAVPAVGVTVSRGAALREVPGAEQLRVRLERADPARHAELVHRVHAAAGRGRPGWITRPTPTLRAQRFFDPPDRRDGAEPLRLLTVDDGPAASAGPASAGPAASAGGGVRGWALFARTHQPDGGSGARVVVQEAAAVDAAAARALWAALLDLDLTSAVQARLLAPDDALLTLLVDVRAAAPTVRDHVWVRLVDLPTALAARRYSAPVDVVLDVTDTLLPANAGRWHLQGDGDGARVERTTDEPQLALDVRDLGAAYLGGVGLGALGAAGLVRELAPGALAAASTAFGWPVAPACSWSF